MIKKNEAINSDFSGLGIAPALLAKLTKLKFLTPTAIQKQAIPAAIQGKDVVGIAQTGTGKTLAFGLPMLQRLNVVKGQGLVVLPTRELASQVEETLKLIGESFGLRTALLIGGASMGMQLRALRQKPNVIIATPGRLNDHLQQRTVSLSNVKIVVLDEADRMLDMGFAPQIESILKAVSRERQTMLFSATMPSNIFKLATKYMQLPLRIEVAPPGTTASHVTQEIYIISQRDKARLTEKILEKFSGSTLIFTRTKHGAKKLARDIRAMGHTASEIHSNRSLSQRQEALAGFKMGKYRMLVATDIASRGIDVKNIELVLNYDLPMNSEDYVHRIGRTARAGAGGHAISFVTPEQRREIRDIERLIKRNLPISKIPTDLPPARHSAPIDDRDEGYASRGSFNRGSFARGRRRPMSNGGRSRGFRR